MKITALEEYGLRCMLSLARNWPEKSVTMPELSTMEGLSIPYIGKLMIILKQARLVKAIRGRNGGYKLSDPPDKIHLDTVLKALGEPIYTSKHCDRYVGESKVCVHVSDCNVRHMWLSFNDFISSILHNLTLADLLNGNYKMAMLTGKSLRMENSSSTKDTVIESAERQRDISGK
ncbi:MAG: Rrf2 family transcriptional regulator [candidate division Zixibacteria bacterium]|nr:Rrf2 family transcriptional regulator [candidate division Zixibacteria bacterium]